MSPDLAAAWELTLTQKYPAFANSVHPDQLASANWSVSALFAIMWIYSNNPEQVIWLAEN